MGNAVKISKVPEVKQGEVSRVNAVDRPCSVGVISPLAVLFRTARLRASWVARAGMRARVPRFSSRKKGVTF
jgi:hypothetical protein